MFQHSALKADRTRVRYGMELKLDILPNLKDVDSFVFGDHCSSGSSPRGPAGSAARSADDARPASRDAPSLRDGQLPPRPERRGFSGNLMKEFNLIVPLAAAPFVFGIIAMAYSPLGSQDLTFATRVGASAEGAAAGLKSASTPTHRTNLAHPQATHSSNIQNAPFDAANAGDRRELDLLLSKQAGLAGTTSAMNGAAARGNRHGTALFRM
jgi:hypothetical protein